MAAIASLSDQITKWTTAGGSKTVHFLKANPTATIPLGGYVSTWVSVGTPCGAAAAPGAVAAPDNTTPGSLRQASPSSGTNYIMNIAMTMGSSSFDIILYDRLLHVSGFNGTLNTAQTVGGALTRYTDGIGNQIWAETYTTTGVTAQTLTASYTNQAGTSGRTATALGFTGSIGRAFMLQLAAGDDGVQAVANATLAGSTGGVGNWGITVAHPLMYLSNANLTSGDMVWRDCVTGLPGPIQIHNNACLALMAYAHTNSGPLNMVGYIGILES